MKINIAIVDKTEQLRKQLQLLIHTYCPTLTISTVSNSLLDISTITESIDLIFINHTDNYNLKLVNTFSKLKEAEYIACFRNIKECQTPLNALNPCSYLKLPIDEKLLILAVESARYRIQQKQSFASSKISYDKIAIPSINGLDFIKIEDIVRCEGLTNCTKIVMLSSEKNIVSSYNIGEFKKLLLPHGFYSPHKSHLINLSHVKHYKREGIIIMDKDSKAIVPVARSKRQEFLGLIQRI